MKKSTNIRTNSGNRTSQFDIRANANQSSTLNSTKSQKAARPPLLSLKPENIPDELKEYPQWVGWKLVYRKGDWTKPPIDLKNGKSASCTNPDTWTDCETAIKSYKKYLCDGIGFVLTKEDPFTAIDLDHCVDPLTGEIDPDAEAIVSKMDSNSEISPSGTGLRIFGKGRKPGSRCRDGENEIYDSNRYLTITGHRLSESPTEINERQPELDELYSSWFPQPTFPTDDGPSPSVPDDKQIQEIANSIVRCKDAKAPDKFHELCAVDVKLKATWECKRSDLKLNGNGKPGNSYDLSLANQLTSAGFTNQEIADTLIEFRRKNGDKPEKASVRLDYVTRTIAVARSSVAGSPAGVNRVNIEDLVAKIIASDDPKEIYDQKNIDIFASLTKADVSKVEIDLKGHFKTDFNRNNFKAAVKEVRAKLKKTKRRTDSDLPTIVVNDRQLRDVVDETMAALKKGNYPPALYAREKELVQIRHDEDGRPFISCHSRTSLKNRLSQSANFTTNEDGDIFPPNEIAEAILTANRFPFPALQGITGIPILRQDGSILETPGYDERTRFIYIKSSGLKLLPIPQNPSQDDASKALQYIKDEVLPDFPFVDSTPSCIHATGAMLTSVVRPMISGSVPLFIINGTTPGSGKTLLADVISIIATGHPGHMLGMPDKGEELEKVIGSALLSGSPLIIFDNVDKKLKSAPLARVITSKVFSFRVLGLSKKVDAPVNAMFMCTGNNIELGGDMPRRAFWCSMDPRTSRPWERTVFKHQQLQNWITEHRGDSVSALITIARAWAIANDRPDGDVTIGGFEDWSRTIGGMLKYAGADGFLQDYSKMVNASDQDTEEWLPFLEKWYELWGDRAKMVSDIYFCLDGGRDHVLDGLLPSFIWERIERKTYHSAARSLGGAFRRIMDRRFGDNEYCLEKIGKDPHLKVNLWRVCKYR